MTSVARGDFDRLTVALLILRPVAEATGG